MKLKTSRKNKVLPAFKEKLSMNDGRIMERKENSGIITNPECAKSPQQNELSLRKKREKLSRISNFRNNSINSISFRLGVDPSDVRDIINEFLANLIESLHKYQMVEIRGLGTFKVLKRTIHGYDFHTAKMMKPKTMNRIKFYPHKALKEELVS